MTLGGGGGGGGGPLSARAESSERARDEHPAVWGAHLEGSRPLAHLATSRSFWQRGARGFQETLFNVCHTCSRG